MAIARAAILLLTLGLWSLGTRAGEVTLTLASAWSQRQNFTADFLRYVEAVNRAGQGLVQIRFLGGPEAVPEQQLLYALRRGVIDMAFGGMTYYRGVLPEGDALFASTLDPDRARASGALDALQPYWRERINAHLVGWVQAGMGAQFYLRTVPRFRADGLPDLTGLAIRTSPSNREMLDALGARAVQIPVSEIYTALERGMVDGIAFTTIGLPDLGVGQFIHYRIDPPVLQLSVCLQVNLDTWNRLAPAARALLEAEAIRYEHGNRERFLALQAGEQRQLAADGLKSVSVAPERVAAFSDLAFETVWQRLAARAPASAARLRPLFWPESPAMPAR
ncbi:Solute-binding protein [Gammaproteobacteria bacterium]|nr:TRAP transporter substrate-binding protein DctP [Gammaproteobacteria bacterium]QOJ32813.1 MAG: TRAP transporter substrate-binding protein DctP [Gammaproteobacteria bacterium]CAG0944296.1 Solute-binding protein [Gammaproteobacteria bacterium]